MFHQQMLMYDFPLLLLLPILGYCFLAPRILLHLDNAMYSITVRAWEVQCSEKEPWPYLWGTFISVLGLPLILSVS